MDDTTSDAILGGRLTLRQPAKGHRAGSDAVLAAAAVPAKAGDLVADFGAGVGTIGLAVLARVPNVEALLVEMDVPTAALAEENAAANGLSERARVLAGDVARIGTGETSALAGTFDHVVSNPPFNPHSGRRPPDEATARARVAPGDLLEVWTRAAARLLKPGGSVTFVHRPDALSGVLQALEGRFGGINLRFVHAVAGAEAVRLLVQACKGSRAPLRVLPPFILNRPEGGFTAEAEAVHRDLAPLAMDGK